MIPEGYCDSGVHYIGDRDECWRCQMWIEGKLVARLVHAALVARAVSDDVVPWLVCSYPGCREEGILHYQIKSGGTACWRCPKHRMAEGLRPPF